MAGRASVGARSPNHPDDVRAVKTLLNLRIADLELSPLAMDGKCDPATIRAIRSFQARIMAVPADGRVDVGGRTARALEDVSLGNLTAQRATAADARLRMSGKAWWHANQAKFPNSDRLSDLSPAFSTHATDFIQALRKAGATVTVSATLRNVTRVYLMHYCWKLAKGTIAPNHVPYNDKARIIWDHGDDAVSRAAASDMVALFGIAYQPSLTSNHVNGTAVDMTIDWTGPISVTDARGHDHAVDKPRSGATNDVLHRIGASFGLHKLLVDAPHWSDNGH